VTTLAVFLVAGPLAAGAVIAGLSVAAWGRRLVEPVAVVVAVLVTVGAAASAVGTGAGAQVVWLGGWSSVRGRPIGIALVADRPALLLLCLVGVLTLVALIWSWHFRADTGAS